MSGDYHAVRLAEDERRGAVWRALWQYYFRDRIRPDACVLDLGAGYGDFINTVVARRRIAVDSWSGLADHVAPGVEAHVTAVTDLNMIEDGSVDFAFASNLFEHLTQADFLIALKQISRALSNSGTLTLIQPNYRYAFREYFDDYTHVSAYSHISIADFLGAHGWEVVEVQPRFLPLTIKSRLPVWPPLIAAYLRSPIKPMGKQMLVVARPR